MRVQHAIPAQLAGRAKPVEDTALEANPSWSKIEELRLRPISAATYSGLVEGLAADEALIARVALVSNGRLFPREKEVACWVAHGGKYNELIHGSGAGNRAIKGYYAISKDRLLSLVFS